MSEPVSNFPETQGPEATEAQRLIDFAFNYDPAVQNEESAQATSELLQCMLDLKGTPQERGFEWQCLTEASPTSGYGSLELSDGSKLSAFIMLPNSASGARISGDVTIHLDATYATRGIVTDEELSQKFSSVDYRVEEDSATIKAEPNPNDGIKIAELRKLEQMLSDAGGINEQDERVMSLQRAEFSLMMEGIDPDTDPEVEEMRAENAAYRIYSDYHRKQFADSEFRGKFDMSHDVGVKEARALIALLKLLNHS